MRIATLAMTLALALGVAATASAAPAADITRAADQSVAVQPQDVPVAQIAQAQESPGIDVNVDVSRGSGGAWYTSPIWIAIFVLGGLLLLVLVAMAARGGGGAPQGTTIVK
jgi:hypothetical protein